ncbi:alginate export family protein [bacterium]|nr:alginate export family protein [bacterium]
MSKRVLLLTCALALMIGTGMVTVARAYEGVYGEMAYRWNGVKNADQNSDVDDALGYSELLAALDFNGTTHGDASYRIILENYRVLGDPASDTKEIYQATFTLHDFLFQDFDVTFGRLPVAYGRERMVGKNSWALNPEERAVFEGYHARYGFDGGWLDFFNFKMAETYGAKYATMTGDTDLGGLYLHYDAGDDFWFEPYALLLTTENFAAPEDISNDKLFTFGALVDYMDEGIHFYAEAAVQSGTSYGLGTETDTSALGWYAGLFYDFDHPTAPYLGVEYDFASGEDAGTAELDAFGSLAGSSRDYLGIMNLVPWSDVKALRFAGGFSPVASLDVSADFFTFAKEQVADGADDGIGKELDITMDYALEEDVALHWGLGAFFFDEPTGGSEKSEAVEFPHAYEAPGDAIFFTWLGASLEF